MRLASGQPPSLLCSLPLVPSILRTGERLPMKQTAWARAVRLSPALRPSSWGGLGWSWLGHPSRFLACWVSVVPAVTHLRSVHLPRQTRNLAGAGPMSSSSKCLGKEGGTEGGRRKDSRWPARPRPHAASYISSMVALEVLGHLTETEVGTMFLQHYSVMHVIIKRLLHAQREP